MNLPDKGKRVLARGKEGVVASDLAMQWFIEFDDGTCAYILKREKVKFI